MKTVPHSQYVTFQSTYGDLPAGDKNDLHLIKSRMLQGIYRGERVEGVYCNYLANQSGYVNFMRNKRLEADAIEELGEIRGRKRLTDEKRLTSNLLSSQPLAFNLFLPLRWDSYVIARDVFQKLCPSLNIAEVTDIRLEYVPGDESNEKSNKIDNSCFDVYIEYRNEIRLKCGLGIEVKYTEPFSNTDFSDKKNEKRHRYVDAVLKYDTQFHESHLASYLSSSFNQLFRNQLLTHVALEHDEDLSECALAVVYSANDHKCVTAISQFDKMLLKPDAFIPITIETLVKTIINYSGENEELKNLYAAIYERYCNYSLVEPFFKD